ncbi:MAG: 50S ribosomal protein L4 [Patescibacteria group bacterium]
MKASIYNTSAKEVGEIELPDSIFGVKRNDALVHQVVLAMQANARTPVAHTKGRGEVRGGGKKPWKQKGTGRARHGSIRSPIWRGGGTTHGPVKERDFSQKINKKMRAKAVATVLSEKLRKGKMIFVDSLSFKAPKTKDAKATLGGLAKIAGFAELATRRNNAALILLSKHDVAAVKSFRNMKNVMVDEARNANPVDLLTYRYILIVDPQVAVKTLSSRLSDIKAKS